MADTKRLELEITDLGHRGQGVGRHGSQVVFVEGALPGERVAVGSLSGRGRQRGAVLLEVLRPSPQRRRPPCILADHCGGCSLQALEPGGQEAWKQGHVEAVLRRIGGLAITPRPLLRSGQELHYRNRALIPLERTDDGEVRAGYYRRGSHRIVNLNHCPVLDPRLDGLIAPIKQDLAERDWPIDRHGGGGLRHLGLRLGQHSGEILITLVACDRDLPGLEALAEAWLARWPAVVGVTLNLQPEATNVLLGSTTQVLAGRGWLAETFAGLQMRIATDTFFQVHTAQAERVVPLLLEALAGALADDSARAIDAADGEAAERDEKRPRLVDAYCGIGTYSLPLAAAGWQVHGIEQHPGAVELAGDNARLNGLGERCSFEAAAVAAVLEERLQGADALFLDPPRRGLEPRALEAVLANPPASLAYLSCDPATLARDLSRLAGEGGPYRLNWVQPIDFFPNTTHVECLASLSLSCAVQP